MPSGQEFHIDISKLNVVPLHFDADIAGLAQADADKLQQFAQSAEGLTLTELLANTSQFQPELNYFYNYQIKQKVPEGSAPYLTITGSVATGVVFVQRYNLPEAYHNIVPVYSAMSTEVEIFNIPPGQPLTDFFATLNSANKSQFEINRLSLTLDLVILLHYPSNATTQGNTPAAVVGAANNVTLRGGRGGNGGNGGGGRGRGGNQGRRGGGRGEGQGGYGGYGGHEGYHHPDYFDSYLFDYCRGVGYSIPCSERPICCAMNQYIHS